MRAIVVIAVMASPAVAQPVPASVQVDFSIDVQPPGGVDAAPPEPPPPPPRPPRVELGVHVGVAHTTQTYSYYDAQDELGPHGTGLAADASAGLRVRPWLSVAAVGTISAVGDPGFVDDYGNHVGITDRMFELAARGRLHFAGAFVGATAGVALDRRSLDWGGVRPEGSHWLTGLVVGVEAGYTGQAHDGVAPEIVLAVSHCAIPEGDGVSPMWPASAALTTVRASAGVAF